MTVAKGCHAHLQIEMLTYLSSVAKGPVQKAEVLINTITVTFDMNQPTQASRKAPGQRLAWSLRLTFCS